MCHLRNNNVCLVWIEWQVCIAWVFKFCDRCVCGLNEKCYGRCECRLVDEYYDRFMLSELWWVCVCMVWMILQSMTGVCVCDLNEEYCDRVLCGPNEEYSDRCEWSEWRVHWQVWVVVMKSTMTGVNGLSEECYDIHLYSLYDEMFYQCQCLYVVSMMCNMTVLCAV